MGRVVENAGEIEGSNVLNPVGYEWTCMSCQPAAGLSQEPDFQKS